LLWSKSARRFERCLAPLAIKPLFKASWSHALCHSFVGVLIHIESICQARTILAAHTGVLITASIASQPR
jgi:hypothetical protein